MVRSREMYELRLVGTSSQIFLHILNWSRGFLKIKAMQFMTMLAAIPRAF